MSENRESIEHNVKFIFQSSEEMSPRGARQLVNAGVLDDVVVYTNLLLGYVV